MIAIIHANMVTPSGDIAHDQTILIEGTKFAGVGHDLAVPEHATILNAQGKVVTPGLIDVHTHLGVHESGVGKEGSDFNETSNPVTPEVRALDGLNPFESGFQDAIRSGVTTVQVLPGSANVIGGEIVAVKTYGRIADDMVIQSPSGMKAAFGENPKRVHGSTAVTRMGVAARFRQAFQKAQDYLQSIESGEQKQRDLGMENLCKVLRGEIPLRAHAHRADDIVTVLRLADEFKLKVTLEHCTEGHLIADYVADKGVRVAVGPTMSSRSKVELSNKSWETVIALANAGVPVSITTDHPVVSIEYLMTTVATAVNHGLDENMAWLAVTLNAAKHIGIDERVGSIEVGKDADLVVWSGHPFDLRQRVEMTMIDGRMVYEDKFL
jgi:imidazolonepropionase-like amidohydrolase